MRQKKIRVQVTLFVFWIALASCISQPSETTADAPKNVPNREKIPDKEESWSVIYLSGHRIGYSHVLSETVDQNGIKVIKTSSLNNMTIKRFGQELKLKQSLSTEELLNGNMLRFRFEMANPPALPSITSGKIDGKNLSLTQEVNGKAQTTVEPWSPDVKSPVYLDRVIRENPLKPGETRTFEIFVPDFAKTGTMTVKAHDWEKTKMLNNAYQKLFKVTSTHSLLPGVATESYLDETGDTVKSSTSILGSTMEVFVVTESEALKSIEGTELDLAINTLIKVKPLLKSHESKKIVYRVTILDQNPAHIIPEGDSQTLKSIDNETAELTVISLPIPQTAVIGPVPAEFLESSQYVQWQDERIRKHAEAASAGATDPAEIARRMEKYVYQRMSKKNFSTAMASAAEVAQSMEGDCTEHAVLLAAMLRAKGIPSRIVVGLVYGDRLFAFGGHMWTEANLNGKWVPLDATLGEGGIGAAHIKLAQSSLSDKGPVAVSSFAPLMTVIGKLKLEILSEQ